MLPLLTLSLLLPHILPLVSARPFAIYRSGRELDIWVTKENTLNATTWNGFNHTTNTHSSHANQTTFNNTKAAGKVSSIHFGTVTTLLATVPSTNTHIVNETTDLSSTSLSSGAATYKTVPASAGSTATTSGNTTTSDNTTITTQLNSFLAVDRLVNTNFVGNGFLSLELINKLPSTNVKAWVTGLDPNGALIMLGQDGNWVYPTTSSATPEAIMAAVTIPLAGPNTTLPITLPGYITSSRVWIADGDLQFYVVATPNGPGLVEPAVANSNDPNADVNYSFAELSWGSNSGIYADISAVDFVGLPLGIQLVDTSGAVSSVLGTPADAAIQLCDQLTAQSKVDNRPWDQLCARDSSGDIIRVLAPNVYLSSNPTAFGTYYGLYVHDVWQHYRTNDLIINTQTDAGNVTCRVVGDLLTCDGDNRGYARPTNYDIFGCNTGPFAILPGDNAIHYAVVPRLCAAFNRATLLIDGGNVTPSLPPSRYYQPLNRPVWTRPKNWYSQLVHQMEVNGKGYAFSYDDVTPSPEDDQSGLVASTSPSVLRIIVGGA